MKRIVAIIIAAVMLLSLAACGTSGSTTAPAAAATTSTENKEPAAAPAQEAAAEPESAPAAEDIKWPERPIEVIIPYGAGGDTDFNAGAYLEGLSKELGVNVIGTNLTGAGGTVASRQVKDAAPDGYQVLFFHSAINVNEVIGTADFGIHDFKLAGIAAMSPGEIITMRADSGITNLQELYDYSKAHPGELKIAMDTGTMVHVQSLMLQKAGFDIDLIDVGGASDRVAALAGGHCDIIINAYGTVKDYIEKGDFVAIAHTNATRSEGYPDIPTAAEQGYDLTLLKHYFFAFPKDTPQEYVDKFAAACEKVAATPEYAKNIMDAYRQTPFTANAEDGLKYMDEFKAVVQSFVDELLGS